MWTWHGVLVPDVLARPQVLHQLAPGDDPLRPLREEREHLELRQRQPHGLAVDRHLVAAEVEVESAEVADGRARAVRTVSSRRRRIARTRLRNSAVENGFVT